MAVSELLLASGMHKPVFKPFSLVLRPILNMDEHHTAIFILSMIGGYPVGARLVERSVAQGLTHRKDAARLSALCFGSGPSFVVGVAGVAAYQNAGTGLLMFCACVLSAIIVAAAANWTRGKIALPESKRCEAETAPKMSADLLFSSSASAAKTLFLVCTTIVIFSVAIHLLLTSQLYRTLLSAAEAVGISSEWLNGFVSALLEISNIRTFGAVSSPALTAAILSFGGVCVLLQVMSIGKGILRLKSFFLARIAQGGLAFVITSLLLKLFPNAVPASFAPSTAIFKGANPFASLALAAMAAILVFESVRINYSKKSCGKE